MKLKLLLIAIVFAIAGCAVTVPYTPNKVTLEHMTPSVARTFLKEIDLTRQPIGVMRDDEYSRKYTDMAADLIKQPLMRMATIVLTNTELVFITLPHYDPSFGELRGIYTVKFNKIENADYNQPFLYSLGMRQSISNDNNMLYIADPQLGQKVADAIYVLKETATEEAQKEEASFELALQSYLSAATKPSFPEDARRFKIQAETAMREKRYADAVNIYEKGLSIAPWWAEGHFNRAMMLKELDMYASAVVEMKRYLKLDPHAANSRTVQDKIYEWEGKIK